MTRRAWFAAGALLATAVLGGARASGQSVLVGRPAPDIAGVSWINSAPLTTEALRGRVVLVEFWTYG